MDRFPFDQPRLRPEAFLAFLIGVVVSYVVQTGLEFGGGAGVVSLNTIVVAAVGGVWYHWRKIT